MKIQAPPEWGIEPVPETHRILQFPDYLALWSSLGVGLLVLLAGTLLVPGLGLGQALLAIFVGSVIGSLLLAVAGVVGSDHAIPTIFGVLVADYFLLRRRRYDVAELYRPAGRYWYRGGFNPQALLAWAVGIAAYHLVASRLPWLGASVPSFLLALAVYGVLGSPLAKK